MKNEENIIFLGHFFLLQIWFSLHACIKCVMSITSLCYFIFFLRKMTQSEFILPLTKSMRKLGLYRQLSPNSEGYKIKHSIPNMDASVSIRPQLCLTKKDIEQRYVIKLGIMRHRKERFYHDSQLVFFINL